MIHYPPLFGKSITVTVFLNPKKSQTQKLLHDSSQNNLQTKVLYKLCAQILDLFKFRDYYSLEC